jgi:hypothetical protein
MGWEICGFLIQIVVEISTNKMLNDRKINKNGESLRIWEQTIIRNSISNYKWTICRMTGNTFET